MQWKYALALWPIAMGSWACGTAPSTPSSPPAPSVATSTSTPTPPVSVVVPRASAQSIRAIPYDLPTSEEMRLPPASPGSSSRSEVFITTTLLVDVNESRQILVDGSRKRASEITNIARAALEKDAGLRAIIRADRAVPWGDVIAVLDALKQAGVAKIAFAVDPVQLP